MPLDDERRGVDITLIKRFTHGFSGELDYTYGNATGTASDPNRALPVSGSIRANTICKIGMHEFLYGAAGSISNANKANYLSNPA